MGIIQKMKTIRERERVLTEKGYPFPKRVVIKSIFKIFFTIPKNLDFVPDSHNLIEWYKNVLKDSSSKSDLFILAGELSFAWYNNDIINYFEKALANGKQITVICGPEIAYNENNRSEVNPLVNLIEKYPDSLHIFLLPALSERPSHFAICNNHVFIELPHDKYCEPHKVMAKAIDDSILWRDSLAERYQNLLLTPNVQRLKRIEEVQESIKDYIDVLQFKE